MARFFVYLKIKWPIYRRWIIAIAILLGIAAIVVIALKKPNIFKFLRPAFNLLPDIAAIFLALFLAALGIALFVVPEKLKKLEDHPKLRFAVALGLVIIALLVGVGGVISSFVQKAEQKGILEKEKEEARIERVELRKQVSTLINSAQFQATSDDIKNLGSQMKTGFDRVASAIEGKKISTPEPKPEPEKLTPTIENTRLVQKSVPSDDPQLPYGLQIIIQSNIVIQPVAFAFECDGEVGKVNFFIAGQGVYMNIMTGVARDNKNIAIVRFSFPSLTPESPLVVTLLSKTQIKVIKAYKLNP
jgi:hypothetical protein